MNQKQAKIIIKACPTQEDFDDLRPLLASSMESGHYRAIKGLAHDGAVMSGAQKLYHPFFTDSPNEYTAIPKRRVNWRKVMGMKIFVTTSQSKSSIEPIIGIQHRLDGSTHIRLIGGMWYPEDKIILKDLPDEYYEDIE